MDKRLKGALLLTTVLVQVLICALPISRAEGGNWVLQGYSFRSSTGGSVYPGSRNTRLIITLRYVGGEDALNPTACITTLPREFQVVGSTCSAGRDADGNVMHVVKPGNTTYFTYVLNVEKTAIPRSYYAVLNVSYYDINDNKLMWESFYLDLEVSPYPSINVVVKDAYFTPYGYPGACPVHVVVGFRNRGSTNIVIMRLVLEMPNELADPSKINYTYIGNIDPEGEVYVDLGVTCINPSADANSTFSGVLYISAQLVTDDGVLYRDEHHCNVTFTLENIPEVKVRVLDYGLTSGSSLPGFKNTSLRILVRSEEPGTLQITHSTVMLENALTVNASAIATYAHNFMLNYLESAWITYSGINVAESAAYIKANITVYGSVLRDGVKYAASTNLLVVIELRKRDINVLIEKVAWADGYAYPGSTGNALVLTLLNNETDLSVVDAVVEVAASNGALYPDKLVVYNVMLNSGSLVELTFTGITIPSTVKPGIYELTVSISGVLRARDNSFRYVKIVRNSATTIEDLSKLGHVLPVFSIVGIFWGEGVPQYAYPGNARTPLTVILQNNGTVPVSNLLLFIDRVLPGDVEILNGVAQCGAQIAPGGTCVAVFYLDLSRSVSGLKFISFIASYTLQGLGTNTVFAQPLTATLFLPEYSAGTGLVVAGYNWLNNNPVFPRTKGAVISITLANLEPYTVYSIWVYVKTPPCMNIHKGSSRSIYVAGPLVTLQTITVSFTLDLDNCVAGVHPLTIETDYYLQIGGGGVRKRMSHSINLLVESDENGVEYLASGWLNTPLNPPVHGAQYYVVFRNNAFPRISNPVLKLHLPQGIAESKTNSSLAVVLPTYRLTAQQAYLLLQGVSSNIAQLISQYLSQQPVVQSASKGDFILYVVSLNIEKVNETEFTIPYTITFIDHWDYEYSVAANFTMKILSAPPLVDVYPATPLVVFRNGTALLDVVVGNGYSTPISNLYVALIPTSGNVIPQGAVKYIEKLEAHSNVVLRYELVYNPVQITVGSVPMTMSSAVFTVTLIYVDVAGGLHTMNTTLATMIAPFIELTIMPGTSARYSKNSLLVNGVLANTGISSARSVVAYLKYSGVEAISIIGDVDPASQTPFRIELQAPYNGDNCTLIVKYRDEYGSEYTVERVLEVVFVPEKTETVPPAQQPQIDVFRLLIVALVAAFLGGVIYIIYRYVKRVVR